MFSDRGSRQFGRDNSENGGGQDAKNLRVKVFYEEWCFTEMFDPEKHGSLPFFFFQHGSFDPLKEWIAIDDKNMA